jgi:hypothetical protein
LGFVVRNLQGCGQKLWSATEFITASEQQDPQHHLTTTINTNNIAMSYGWPAPLFTTDFITTSEQQELTNPPHRTISQITTSTLRLALSATEFITTRNNIAKSGPSLQYQRRI